VSPIIISLKEDQIKFDLSTVYVEGYQESLTRKSPRVRITFDFELLWTWDLLLSDGNVGWHVSIVWTSVLDINTCNPGSVTVCHIRNRKLCTSLRPSMNLYLNLLTCCDLVCYRSVAPGDLWKNRFGH